MTFDLREISQADGQPVELYEFALGSEQFNYTSAEDEIAIGATKYTPVEIERTTILLGAETRRDVLTVTMPSSVAPASRYVTIVPGQRGTLTIKRQHRTDTPTPETIVIFKGLIRAVGFTDDGFKTQMAVVPLTAGLGREIPRFTFQGLCNHVLYDSRCKVLQSNFQTTAVVTAVVGNVLTIPGLNVNPDGFFTSGFVQLQGGLDFRLILEHVGNDVTLLLPFPDSVLDLSVDTFAGCDRTLATCKTKFDAVLNYGGFAFVPLRDIFRTGIDV